jgi:hypothetical protein
MYEKMKNERESAFAAIDIFFDIDCSSVDDHLTELYDECKIHAAWHKLISLFMMSKSWPSPYAKAVLVKPLLRSLARTAKLSDDINGEVIEAIGNGVLKSLLLFLIDTYQNRMSCQGASLLQEALIRAKAMTSDAASVHPVKGAVALVEVIEMAIESKQRSSTVDVTDLLKSIINAYKYWSTEGIMEREYFVMGQIFAIINHEAYSAIDQHLFIHEHKNQK